MPIELCQRLVQCRSVTPRDAGVMQVIVDALQALGFECKLFSNKEPYNLFASYNFRPGALGFLGHVDVVPAGVGWDCDPFAGHVSADGELIARGAADMKGAIACYIRASEECIAQNPDISLAFYITGDEEVGEYDGTQSLLEWARLNSCLPGACVIGEPSSIKEIGDRVYVGHRGSCNITVRASGQQKHVAYAQNHADGSKDNAIAKLCFFLNELHQYRFEVPVYQGFAATNLETTIITAANYATNVIPEYAEANVNVRFCDRYTFEMLQDIVEEIRANCMFSHDISLKYRCSGEAYICTELCDLALRSIFDVQGFEPEFSCAGGISDGRFMVKHCPIIEIGLSDATIHQKNERVPIHHFYHLKEIYKRLITNFFASPKCPDLSAF